MCSRVLTSGILKFLQAATSSHTSSYRSSWHHPVLVSGLSFPHLILVGIQIRIRHPDPDPFWGFLEHAGGAGGAGRATRAAGSLSQRASQTLPPRVFQVYFCCYLQHSGPPRSIFAAIYSILALPGPFLLLFTAFWGFLEHAGGASRASRATRAAGSLSQRASQTLLLPRMSPG